MGWVRGLCPVSTHKTGCWGRLQEQLSVVIGGLCTHSCGSTLEVKVRDRLTLVNSLGVLFWSIGSGQLGVRILSIIIIYQQRQNYGSTNPTKESVDICWYYSPFFLNLFRGSLGLRLIFQYIFCTIVRPLRLEDRLVSFLVLL